MSTAYSIQDDVYNWLDAGATPATIREAVESAIEGYALELADAQRMAEESQGPRQITEADRDDEAAALATARYDDPPEDERPTKFGDLRSYPGMTGLPVARPGAPLYPGTVVDLIGADGNAMTLIGSTQVALRASGVPNDEIMAFFTEAIAGDYDHVLTTIAKWVTVPMVNDQ